MYEAAHGSLNLVPGSEQGGDYGPGPRRIESRDRDRAANRVGGRLAGAQCCSEAGKADGVLIAFGRVPATPGAGELLEQGLAAGAGPLGQCREALGQQRADGVVGTLRE